MLEYSHQGLEHASLLLLWHCFLGHFQGGIKLKLVLAVCCAVCQELTGTSPAAGHLAPLTGSSHVPATTFSSYWPQIAKPEEDLDQLWGCPAVEDLLLVFPYCSGAA